MDVRDLRFYGRGFSDAEASWPDALKAEMKRKGKAVVLSELGLWEKLRFGWRFAAEHRRMRRVDLSAIRARGMNNEAFLAQQIEYIALFSALASLRGRDEAVRILCRVMDETAREALLLCLPESEEMSEFSDPFAAWRDYLAPAPEAARAAGCQELAVVAEGDVAVQMNVTWCVWLELARTLGVPEACIPNCYSDELVFPAYFEALGMRYRRTTTLATGGACCDFRFERG